MRSVYNRLMAKARLREGFKTTAELANAKGWCRRGTGRIEKKPAHTLVSFAIHLRAIKMPDEDILRLIKSLGAVR